MVGSERSDRRALIWQSLGRAAEVVEQLRQQIAARQGVGMLGPVSTSEGGDDVFYIV
jgi:hypothetical protein